MPDELSPDQLQQIINASVSPERMDILKRLEARSEALRNTAEQHAPQAPREFHSLGAGLLSGVAGMTGNLASKRQHDEALRRQDELLKQLVGSRSAAMGLGHNGMNPEDLAQMPTPMSQPPMVNAPGGGGMTPEQMATVQHHLGPPSNAIEDVLRAQAQPGMGPEGMKPEHLAAIQKALKPAGSAIDDVLANAPSVPFSY